MGAIIEIVTFRLTPETTEEAFVAAAAQSLAFLARQPGFLHREVGVTVDGEWTDIVRWASLGEALRAAKAFNDAPETQAFNACLVRGSAQMRHVRAVYRSDEATTDSAAAG